MNEIRTLVYLIMAYWKFSISAFLSRNFREKKFEKRHQLPNQFENIDNNTNCLLVFSLCTSYASANIASVSSIPVTAKPWIRRTAERKVDPCGLLLRTNQNITDIGFDLWWIWTFSIIVNARQFELWPIYVCILSPLGNKIDRMLNDLRGIRMKGNLNCTKEAWNLLFKSGIGKLQSAD